MKKPDPGQTIGILANVGVLLGIILLVYELDQNRDMMRAQIRNEISRSAMDLLADTATSKPLAAIMVRVNAGEELSPEENYMFINRAELSFRLWENTSYQNRQGMFDATEYSGNLATISDVLSTNPALVDYWCERRQRFSAPFMAEIDAMPAMQSCR